MASGNIPRHLSWMSQGFTSRWEYPYPEKDADSSKDGLCRRKWLTDRDLNTVIYRRNESFTRPMPSPRVAENVKSMVTMGVNHVINLSSPLRNLSKAWACFRNTSKTEYGELELSRARATGCVPRSCPVRVLYSFDAASNIAVNLGVEESLVRLLSDIEIGAAEGARTVIVVGTGRFRQGG